MLRASSILQQQRVYHGISSKGPKNTVFSNALRIVREKRKEKKFFEKLRARAVLWRTRWGEREKLPMTKAIKKIFNTRFVQRMNRQNRSQIISHWHPILKDLLPLGGTSEGNHVEIYHDGDAAFTEKFRAINSAQSCIRFETYIWEPDPVGLQMIDFLSAAAKRGVDVTVIYDAWGSAKMEQKHMDRLAASGAKVICFNPLLGVPWGWKRANLLFRTHRKILIVDNLIGFCGGMNCAEDFCGVQQGGTGNY